ncbi:MAG: HAD family hydrolase [Selenomonadaceae bacterium]|nr:HAD family hydrolase [Selenomonadaceae bacterium]
MNKAFFFDRDGVLNKDVGYLYKIEKFKWIDGAKETVKLCNEKNFWVVVVTNQSGIARGFYTENDVKILHEFMQNDLKNFGACIDAFYFCPHHPEGKISEYAKICDCRKPKAGMIFQAAKDLNIDLKKSFLIGDSQRDIDAGKNAELAGEFLFQGGNLFEFVKNIFEEKISWEK